MSSCIAPELLRSYLAGKVDPAALKAIEIHLRGCVKCQAAATRAATPAEPLLSAAHEASSAGGFEREPELKKALSVIAGFRFQSDGDAVTSSAAPGNAWPTIRDYQIVKKLGEGGMGAVFLAVHSRLGKKVALKILKGELAGNPQAIARFEREWLAVGKLEHPHIVRAHHAGDENGIYFLAMEYIEGRDLASLLKLHGPLRMEHACELVRQAALGLQHAHDYQLVHRDVKPSNLILSAEGQVKVLDLGLAQLQAEAEEANALTHEGQMVGTWLYMAPEQLSPNGQVDSRSDIFSLGVTFYNVLVGSLPLKRGQLATQLPSITELRGDVPSDVRALLDKMLTPDPEERVQSMSEVALALEVHGKPVSRELLAVDEQEASMRNRGQGKGGSPVIPPPAPRVSARSKWMPWAAASLSALALAALTFALLLGLGLGPFAGPSAEPGPAPPPIRDVQTGGLTVVLASPGMEAMPSLFAVRKGEEDHRIPLQEGENPLGAGAYFVFCEHQDWLVEPESIVVDSQGAVSVAVTQAPHVPWLFPRLPEQPGAYMEGAGTIWMEGMVDPQGHRFDLPYKLRITMGDPEDFLEESGKRIPCQWMMLEVTTHGPSGSYYTETGCLLVDLEEYRRKNNLVVRRGWTTGGGKGIENRLRYLFGRPPTVDAPPSRLAVKMDGKRDVIGTRADEILVRLPRPRISIPDALNLLFGADFESDAPQLREVRLRLAKDSKRAGARELVTGAPQGDLYCWRVKSDDTFGLEENSLGYAYYRHEGVPFSVVKLDARLEKFHATFNLTGYGPEQPATAEKIRDQAAQRAAQRAAELAEVERFASLKRDQVNFDEASLPEAEGAMATYDVDIRRDGSAGQLFEVRLRMADGKRDAQESRPHEESRRWLELTVTSKTGASFQEEALLEVLDLRKEGGAFRVERGWIRAQEEVFNFEPDGDRLRLEIELLKRAKAPIVSPLTVHDVLALLFGAELQSAEKINVLRTMVSTMVARNGLKRAWSSEDAGGKPPIVLFDGSRRAGEVWTVAADSRFHYSIHRTWELPFDFQKVIFTMPNLFELTAVLAQFKEKEAPSLLEPSANDQRALVSRMEELGRKTAASAAASVDPNWREWRDAKGDWWEWAEFRGQLPSGVILLRCQREGYQYVERRVEPKDLRQEDRDWVARGRVWTSADGAFQRQARFEKRVGKWVTLNDSTGEELEISTDKLSERDREWLQSWQAQVRAEKSR